MAERRVLTSHLIDCIDGVAASGVRRMAEPSPSGHQTHALPTAGYLEIDFPPPIVCFFPPLQSTLGRRCSAPVVFRCACHRHLASKLSSSSATRTIAAPLLLFLLLARLLQTKGMCALRILLFFCCCIRLVGYLYLQYGPNVFSKLFPRPQKC